MASVEFLAALPFILRWEGGYVNHPADPGGATNKGVTQAVYDTWRKAQGLAARDVRQLLDDELHAIYENGYWTPPRCHQLQNPLDLAQFDTAVNMGVGRAVRFLQTAVGTTAGMGALIGAAASGGPGAGLGAAAGAAAAGIGVLLTRGRSTEVWPEAQLT